MGMKRKHSSPGTPGHKQQQQQRKQTAAAAISRANQQYLAAATGEQILLHAVDGQPQQQLGVASIRGVPHHITPRLILALKACRPESTSTKRKKAEGNVISGENAQGKALVSSLLQGNDGNNSKVIENNQQKAQSLQDASLFDTVRSFFDLLRQEPSQVQVACASFLIDASVHAKALDNSKVPWKGRRGALKLLWFLLQRSKACREYFCATGDAAIPLGGTNSSSSRSGNSFISSSTSPIRGMVSLLSSTVIDTSSSNSNDATMSTNNNSNHPLKFQQECVSMLHDLSQTFGHIYPHLVVAVRYVEEKRGVVNVMHMVKQSQTTSESLRHAASLTNREVSSSPFAREDLSSAVRHNSTAFATRIGGGLSAEALVIGCKAAFKHGLKECRLVRKIITDVESLMNIVHPNFLDTIKTTTTQQQPENDIGERTTLTNEEETKTAAEVSNEINASENDEDDDFDWEEGEEDGVDLPNEKEDVSERKIFDWNEHEAEVERTLEAMGVSRDHSVVVNFDSCSVHESEIGLSNKVSTKSNPSISVEHNPFSTTVETKDGDTSFLSSTTEYDEKGSGASTDTTNMTHKEERNKLQELVRQLSQKHIPTLEVWLECVVMNPIRTESYDNRKRRLLRILLDTKRDITDILSQASRMGYKVNASTGAEDHETKQANNLSPSPRRLGIYNQDRLQGPTHLRQIAPKQKRQLKIKLHTKNLRIK